MTKGTRNFMLGSIGVLALGLTTGLVALYSSGGLVTSSSQEELVYLPADTAAVGYANVAEVMKSDFRKRIQQVMPTGEQKEALQREVGIDLEKDIDSAVFGFAPESGGGNGIVVLVRGRLDEQKLLSMASQHGLTPEDYKGRHMVVLSEGAKMHESAGMADSMRASGMSDAMHAMHSTGAVAFLEPGLVALGDSNAIKRAIDARESGENITKNDELMKVVKDLRSGSNAWIAGRFDMVSKHVGVPQVAKDQLELVKYFAVGAHINGGLRGVVRAEARDDEAGNNLRAVINGALAAGRLVAGGQQNQHLEMALNSLQMSGSGKTVAVSFSVTPEMLDMLNGLAGLSNLANGPKLVKPGK